MRRQSEGGRSFVCLSLGQGWILVVSNFSVVLFMFMIPMFFSRGPNEWLDVFVWEFAGIRLGYFSRDMIGIWELHLEGMVHLIGLGIFYDPLAGQEDVQIACLHAGN